MNRKQKRKLIGVISILILLSIAIGLVLFALKQNINLFYTPTQVLQNKMNSGETIRIGGYVKKYSVQYDNSGQRVLFVITDKKNEMQIHYDGVLPSLFREGQGVVVTGKLINTHALLANEVLAKHDEKYMPLKIPGDKK